MAHRTYLPVQWNGALSSASIATVGANQLFPAPEMYIPLYWYSSATVGATTPKWLAIGSNVASSSVTASNYLHTLSSLWNAVTNFAFEVSMAAGTVGTASASLYDFTTGSTVAASTVSTTSTTITQVRSGKFLLSPGHIYGVIFSNSNTSYNALVTDASLIAFSS